MESLPPKNAFKFLLICVLINSYTHSTSAVRSTRSSSSSSSLPKTSTDFIRRSCSETSYPRLCISSLSIHANKIQTSPQLLASTALNVTLSSAKTTSNMMLKLSLSHGLKPREAAAMKDCVEELSESVDELRKSIGEMNKLKGRNGIKLMINDIQTWISAALTDESTCSDGFGGKAMDGKLKNRVRLRIVNVAQLTSNALALINRYALITG